jgi:hypothetical protein
MPYIFVQNALSSVTPVHQNVKSTPDMEWNIAGSAQSPAGNALQNAEKWLHKFLDNYR